MSREDKEKKLLDLLPRFEKIREYRDKMYSRKVQRRLKDLYRKIHYYKDDIRIPIPNLWAYAEIEDRYESVDNIDLNNKRQLAFVLVILDNQENPEFNNYSESQIRELTIARMQKIPANEHEDYIKAVYEVFMILKKNSIRKTEVVLQQAKEILAGQK
jgi:hypothetical protein